MWKVDQDALMLQLIAAEKALREQQRHNRTRETLEVALESEKVTNLDLSSRLTMAMDRVASLESVATANLQLSNKLKDTERRIAELECELQRLLEDNESRQKIDAEREIKLRGLELDDMEQKNTIKSMTAKIHKIEEDLGHAKGKVQQTEITLEEANALLAQTRANLASSQVNTRAVEAKLEAEIAKYNLLKDRIGGDMSAIESQLREEVAKLLERNAMLKSGKQKLQLQQLCERMLFQGRLAEVEGARSESDRVVDALKLNISHLEETARDFRKVKRELEAQAVSEKKARDDSEIRVAVAEQAAGERKKLQSQAEAALRDALLVSMCSLFSGVCIVCMVSS